MDPPHPDDAKNSPDYRLVDVGHLTSGVCHYLINVFSAIVSSADMIQFSTSDSGQNSGGVDCAELQAHAAQIVQLALQASDVARGLIGFAQPRLPLAMEQVDLVELLRAVVGRHLVEASSSVRWDDQLGQLPTIAGDREALMAMFDAIVSNAREAVEPTGGAITLASGTDDRGRAFLEIRDDGAGMSAENRQRALEPFFSTKADHLGVGFNLAKSSWVHHGGSIALNSDLGRGTSVRLLLPTPKRRSEKPAS
jgi:signal transduction histidine kinase